MANQYTRLIINNQEIDLSKVEDLPLNITKRINNIAGDIQGDYSRASITVPATKNNILILGDTRDFKPFRILVDGQPNLSGLARVRKGRNRTLGYEGIKATYEINLVSANSNPFILLGEKTLADCTDLVVEYNTIPIVNGFISQPGVLEYGFTFIKLKQWTNVVVGPPLRYRLSLFETTPLLFLKPLIVEGLRQIGWTLESDFFDTDWGSKLTMPVTFPEKLPKAYNDKYLNTEVSITAPVVFPVPPASGNFPFDIIDVAAPSNPTAYDNVLFQYTAPQTGYYQVELEMEFGAVAPPPPYTWFITLEVNNVDVTPRIGFAFSNVAGGPQYPAAGQILKAIGIVQLNAGDLCNFRYAANGGITLNSGKCKFTGEAVIEQGTPLDFKYFLEGDSLLDMIFGVADIHNLTFEADTPKRVLRVEPKDGYVNVTKTPTTQEYKQGFYTSGIKDYTRLIDWKKKNEYEFPAVDARKDFEYKLDNDETAEWIESSNDFGIYEARYPFSGGVDTNKTDKQEVRFFSKTIHILDSLAAYPDTNAIPQFPLIYNGNYALDPTITTPRYDIARRILYFAGQRFGGTFDEDDGVIELQEFQGIETKNPLAFMVNYNDRTGLDPNLGFDNQIINGTLSVGCTNRFHLQDLARLNRGKTEQGYVDFNSVDEQNFTFRIKALISNQRYIVQQLTGFNPTKDSPTEFTFYLDVYPSQADIDNIQNSPVQGVITNESA